MTLLMLLKSLTKNIRNELKNFELSAEYQGNKKITVYEQNMPLADYEVDTFYPNVVIHLKSLEDDGTDSIATIVFSIGIYAGEHERWWIDLFNIAERIRQFILTNPVLDEKFPLMYPIAFEPLEDQREPFFFGNIAARYRVATPRCSIPF